jgi:hypothetical protein
MRTVSRGCPASTSKPPARRLRDRGCYSPSCGHLQRRDAD